MWRSVFKALSPAGTQAQLSTLIFHRVLSAPDPLFPEEVDARRFDAICHWMARWFNVLPLDAAVRQLHAGVLPARAMAITFDDGYEDNCSIALPILQRHGLPATFFVATGFLDGGCMWNDCLIEAVRNTPRKLIDTEGCGVPLPATLPADTVDAKRSSIAALLGAAKYLPPNRRDALCQQIFDRAQVTRPTHLMMRSEQVRQLWQAGMQIGSHTVHHPILAKVDDTRARREMQTSKGELEAITGDAVTLFAYPNGRPGQDYSQRDVALARSVGFEAAVSTAWGTGRHGGDLWQLPRFTPWDANRWKFGARLARNLLTAPRGAA